MSLFISLICNVILLQTEEKVVTKIEYKTDENIVFFGDSITRHYKINEFFPDSNIINSGISGDEASDLVERIEEDVYKYANLANASDFKNTKEIDFDNEPENIKEAIIQLKDIVIRTVENIIENMNEQK